MPKIQLPPNIKKLKEQLESGHNFVDHFLVCGIPPSTCFQDFLYDTNNEKYEEIFKDNAKPIIISRFPEFDNSIDSVDEEIVNYCFPEGFHPISSVSNAYAGKFFTVILDNNLFSSEYPQKYLSCLLFYEKLSEYKYLRNKLKKSGQTDIYDIEEEEDSETDKKETPKPQEEQNKNKETIKPQEEQNKNKEIPKPPEEQNIKKEIPKPPEEQNKNKETIKPPEEQNKNKEIPKPPEEQNKNKETPRPQEEQNKNKEIPKPQEEQNKNKEIPKPPEEQNIKKEIPKPPEEQNKNKETIKPQEEQNKNKEIEENRTPIDEEENKKNEEKKGNNNDQIKIKKQLSSTIIPNISFGENKKEGISRSSTLNFEVVSNKNFLKRSSFITEKKNIFIPKCICLVSIHPYITQFQKILEFILNYASDKKEIPLEKIITNLIIEVPVPPRGLYTIKYTFLNNLILNTDPNNRLQLADISLKKFNLSLDFNIKLEAIKHILLCSKILIFSENLNKISDTILSFLSLLFPFKYPFQVTSYLHKDNYNILESVSPFMIGIKEKYKNNFFEENEICIDGMSIFIIDLDKNEKYIFSDEEFPNFPSKILSTLEKDIKNLENKFKKEPEKDENLKGFNEQYQNLFFEFFCELLKGYEDYLNLDYFKSSDADRVTSIDTLFKCPQFIKTHNNSDIAFYQKFIDESQLFADFIYKRMIPRNNQELVDVLLVNETNIKIRNKQKYFGSKESTDFLRSEAYDPSNFYEVPFPRALTSKEISIIHEKKDTLLNFGQYIIESNTDNETKNNLSFKYFLFPQLDFQTYCNNDNINEYFPPQDYSEEIEPINSDFLSKSSIGQNINLGLEMTNNLYLTWLEIWSYTFWYIDNNERKAKFDQMLDVLDKVIHHEMNIFNLMFEVLNQQNEQKMIVKLYQKILQLKMNPSNYIYNIISNRLDKEEIKVLFEEMKTGNSKSLKFGPYNYKKNERTFASNSDKTSLINNRLTFDTNFFCIDCNEPIDLRKLCKTFEGIKNDILWAPCKQGHYNLPKIRVNFGLELFPKNKNDNSKITTSITDEIVLHSPYNLKINIKNAVASHYGINLNVNEFKTNFGPIFWNFVWYCHLYGLDFSILLPYSKRIEQERAIKLINPNDNKIKLMYDNKLFRTNDELLNKIDLDNIGQESGTLIMVIPKFKHIEQEKVISIEIQQAQKNKNKKAYSKFIEHLVGKSLSVSEIKLTSQLNKTLTNVGLPTDIRGSTILTNEKKIKDVLNK